MRYLLATLIAASALAFATAPPPATGGSSSSGVADIPAAAAAVGDTSLTFNSTIINAGTGPWYPNTFRTTTPSEYYTQNADGSITMQHNVNSGGTLITARPASNPMGFVGTGFGPGYFEWTYTMTNVAHPVPWTGPADFWFMDIEHLSQGPIYVLPWPATTSTFWPSVPQLQNQDASSGYDDYIEIDGMEWDFPCSSTLCGFEINASNWEGHLADSGAINWGQSNVWPRVWHGESGSTPIPPGTDFTRPHKLGVLWVASTGSGQTTTTQGYLAFYFDGVKIAGGLPGSAVNPYDGKARPLYWNYHDPADVAHYPTPAQAGAPTQQDQASPPVVYGDVDMSILDHRHLVAVMGGGGIHNLSVTSFKVWQASPSVNLVVAPPTEKQNGETPHGGARLIQQ